LGGKTLAPAGGCRYAPRPFPTSNRFDRLLRSGAVTDHGAGCRFPARPSPRFPESMATTLITGRPWRVILAFSVPLLIGNVVQQLYHFVDAVVVGRQLGVNSLAAIGATGSLIFLVIGFAWGLSSGFAIPTAQAFGASDARGVRRSVATGTMLTAVTSLILTVVGPLIAAPFLELLQTPPELMAEATAFTRSEEHTSE